jgi:hypothetical protein
VRGGIGVADIDKIHMEDIDITEERVRRKHQVTATHRPTGVSVTRDGIHYYIHAQRRADLS